MAKETKPQRKRRHYKESYCRYSDEDILTYRKLRGLQPLKSSIKDDTNKERNRGDEEVDELG